jgi:hypothetical protein
MHPKKNNSLGCPPPLSLQHSLSVMHAGTTDTHIDMTVLFGTHVMLINFIFHVCVACLFFQSV